MPRFVRPAKAPLQAVAREAIEVLVLLNEEGDTYGRCVLCRSSPCLGTCRIRLVLERAGRK